MIKHVRFLLLLLGALLSAPTSYGQASQLLAQVDSLLEQAHRLGVFNGNVLLAEWGKSFNKTLSVKLMLAGKSS